MAKDIKQLEIPNVILDILVERTQAEWQLVGNVDDYGKQYWSGAHDAFDLVIAMLTGFSADEVDEEVRRRFVKDVMAS